MFDLESAVHIKSDVFHLMIELRRDQSGGVCIEHLIDRRHHSHAHQLLNDLAGLHAHFARQIADRDDLGNPDDAFARFGNGDLRSPDLFAREHPFLPRNAAASQLFFTRF